MVKEINLLQKKNLNFLQQERTIVIVRAIALFSVLIVVSSFVGVLLLGKNYSLSDITAQQAAVRIKIAPFHIKATQTLALSDRVNHIQNVLKTRSLLDVKITTLQKQLPLDIVIDSFSITTKQVTLSVSSSSLSSLKTFLDAMSSMVAQKKLISRLTINNVVINANTGKYAVSIQAVLL